MPTTLELAVSLMKSKGNLQESQSQMMPATVEFLDPYGPKVHPVVRTQPKGLIPKTSEEWMDFMIQMIRTKTCLRYLSDKELKHVVQRARKNFGVNMLSGTNSEPDPDLPECYSWDEKQVAGWLAGQGFPHLTECFILNRLTGRKLVAVDANALVKMGIRSFDEIKAVSSKIRELLGIPRPNMMRALVRIVPFESYLRKRLKTGKTYDLLNFEAFCVQEGFPYGYLQLHNKNAEIPCTCEVSIRTLDQCEDNESLESELSSDSDMLRSAPTVEYFARNVLAHNKVVQEIIDEILGCIFNCADTNQEHCKEIGKTISRIIQASHKSLGLLDPAAANQRLAFTTGVARGLISEMHRTAQVLTDIGETRKQLKKNVTSAAFNDMRAAVSMFMEEVLPLATLMSLGEFSLENIFRQEPEFQKIVQEITTEAEGKIQEVLPEAEEIVNQVVQDAERHANTAD
jgi:hypothetical protein